MPALVRVLGGMTIRRAVATEGDAACLTSPQMNPVVADLHAFFAFAALRPFDRSDRGDVSTGSHMSVPLFGSGTACHSKTSEAIQREIGLK
jgi:hypothetical protein